LNLAKSQSAHPSTYGLNSLSADTEGNLMNSTSSSKGFIKVNVERRMLNVDPKRDGDMFEIATVPP
jgi:hypothetical protein